MCVMFSNNYRWYSNGPILQQDKFQWSNRPVETDMRHYIYMYTYSGVFKGVKGVSPPPPMKSEGGYPP